MRRRGNRLLPPTGFEHFNLASPVYERLPAAEHGSQADAVLKSDREHFERGAVVEAVDRGRQGQRCERQQAGRLLRGHFRQ